MNYKEIELEEKINKVVAHRNPVVRIAAAEAGLGLGTLVNDKVLTVREAVAKYGPYGEGIYGDILAYDISEQVKIAVANHGDALDILKHDESPEVRAIVAKLTRDSFFLNDSDPQVLAALAKVSTDKTILDKLKGSPFIEVRKALAARDLYPSLFKNDKEPAVRAAAVKGHSAKDKMFFKSLVTDKYPLVRISVAKKGVFTQLFKEDPSAFVRATAARHLVAVNTFKDDKDSLVRMAALETGIRDYTWHGDMIDREWFLPFATDKDPHIRTELAKNRIYLEILKSDPHPLVRKEVAKQEVYLTELVNDESAKVAQTAKEILDNRL